MMTYDMLALKGGAFYIVAGLEAKVPSSNERVPFVNLLQAASESIGEDQTTFSEARSAFVADWMIEALLYRWGCPTRPHRGDPIHLRRRLYVEVSSVSKAGKGVHFSDTTH